MKKKIYIFLIIILLLVLSISIYIKLISKRSLNENYINENYINESIFDIYVTNASNDLTLIQIESINDENIKYSIDTNINKKYENASLLYIEKDSNGNVYVPYTKDRDGDTEKTRRVLVFDKGVLEGEIEFDDIRNPQNIISDLENDKIYVEQSITTQSNDSPGLKLKVIDSNSQKVIDEILLKGYIGDYYIGNEEIILSLEGANKLGFIDDQDRSLYAINRKTLEGRIVTKESIPNSVNAICQDSKGNNIIFSNVRLQDDLELEKNEVILMNGDGEIKDSTEVPFDMINNFYGNDKYQYILNGKYPYENNGFLLFNKNTCEFEKFIDDVENISYIENVNGYIFVLTVNSNLFVYDENSLEKIGSIDFGENRSYRMKVVEKN
ncbi:hypothetical protein PTM93_03130 [Clostridium perfringens]|uniref:hypothetical protein n=2 Tax=Clostridium perfringens TaxID=1502 RepID=UPI0013E3A16F|nr:hypothetical protein [Clostridium perfringens]EHK2427147.1 hypothetical protein [Clostridium perfringens]EIF6152685.1 hypothetical protein [Clostridium perfringens]ELC8352445.1 hypothetical protein [Clostridium perfringens]ELC8368814.1 hypothetical protein [Clostridium perfringens]ELC8371853.1 hypothetical protein [Clostridium perfringens]